MKKLLIFFIIFFALFGITGSVFASQTDGTVSGYAWANYLGWINFGCAQCTAHVVDSALTGKVWSENYGWINLNPTQGGVTNDSAGNLAGKAWGEGTGWISFVGATINNSGVFSGLGGAVDIGGQITFSCANCNVTTDWRPASVRSGTPIGGGGPGGGNPPPQSHNQCNGQNQCVSVSGAGSDQCQSNNDCAVPPTHSQCDPQNQCLLVAGIGINQCQVNADCVPAVHNQCNAQNQCVSVSGAGGDQCQNANDCNTSHSQCSGSQCVTVNGIGVDQCQSNNDCAIPKHNICNAQNQCVSVNGAGSDQCLSSSDCAITQVTPPPPTGTPPGQTPPGTNPPANPPGTTPINSLPPALQSPINSVINNVVLPAQQIVNTISNVVKTPSVAVTTKVVSTVGVATAIAAGATSVFASSVSLPELFLIPLRLLSLLMFAFGIKKRNRPWGVVYDSVTKQPIDPAYVTLTEITTKNTYSAVTDIDGRYGFLVKPGTYTLSAAKTNYAFPSVKLANKTNDELYGDLYFGQPLTIEKEGEVIAKNIPLDAIKFDWNEFAKKDKTFMKFYSHWDLVLRRISDGFFVIGFIIAGIAFYAAPYPYNSIILSLYLILLLLRVVGVKPKSFGYVIDKFTQIPYSFAILRIIIPGSNIEIAHKVTDQYGRYYCLVPKGQYYVKIEKKNDDQSYSLLYTSPVIDASKTGIIKNKFDC